MMAQGGNGQEVAEADPLGGGFDIPDLNEQATIRDIAAYMKAFKTTVAKIDPANKQRIATSIQKALNAKSLTTGKLNELLNNPNIHRSFSQPETKLREMNTPKTPTPNEGRAGATSQGRSTANRTPKRPRSQPSPAGTPPAQIQGNFPQITREEWNVLQNVPPQQRPAVLHALRNTPPQQLMQPGYHAYHHHQQGGMPGFQYQQQAPADPNVDPALYGPVMSPTPPSGYMPGTPYMQYAPMTPRASPVAPPHGYHAGGHQMAHAGAHAFTQGQPARKQMPPPQRVEPFAQPRPGQTAGVPQIVKPASPQSPMQRLGRPRNVHGAPRQMLHNGHLANPGVASAMARSNTMKAPMQPPPRNFVRPTGPGGIQGAKAPSRPPTPTSGPQEPPLKSLPEAPPGKGQMYPGEFNAAYYDPNAPHWAVPRPGLDRNTWSGYLNPAAPQSAVPAEKVQQDVVKSTSEDATQQAQPSTDPTAPNSVVDVDAPTSPAVVESIESDEDAEGDTDDEAVVPDESNVNQDEEKGGSPWSDRSLNELFPEYLARYGATHTKDEIFVAVTEELMRLNSSKGANTPEPEAEPGTSTSQNDAPGTNTTAEENVANKNEHSAANIHNDNLSEENLDISDFDPDLFDELFNDQGDWIPEEQATAAIEKAVTEKAAENAKKAALNAQKAAENAKKVAETTEKAVEDTEKANKDTEKAVEDTEKVAEDTEKAVEDTEKVTEDTAEMARSKAKKNKAVANETNAESASCSSSQGTYPAAVNLGNSGHNLISDQATNVPEKEIVEEHDEQDKEIETKKPCDCEQCGRSGSQSTCCIENLSRQHPDIWSFLQPMVRHNCIVYDRNALTESNDLGKPVVALYPHLVGQSAVVKFADEAQTVLQAPIIQVPQELRFIPSMTVFQDGASFANDPVGATEYMYTGKVITDGEASSEDQDLQTYRSYWGETGARAFIGRHEAEANKLIRVHNEAEDPGQTAQQRANLAEKLQKRSLEAVNHTPGSGHTCGAGSNEYLVYNPRLLPSYVENEHVDFTRAIEGANTLNMLQNGITPELTSYIPCDLTDMDARAKLPFTIVVRLSHAPQIFELIPDAAWTRTDRGVPGQEYLVYGSKMLTILAIEMRRQRMRTDAEIFSTLRRLVPHFEELNFTETDLAQWRMQLLRNEEYLEFYWIVRSVVRKDFRGTKLLRMIWENDGRLFNTKRDDEMDTLGLTLTLEEMLRIAGKAIEEEMPRGQKRGREENEEPTAKRAKI